MLPEYLGGFLLEVIVESLPLASVVSEILRGKNDCDYNPYFKSISIALQSLQVQLYR